MLDLLLQKNPIYMKLSQYGLFDATMPVAKFARDRMSERLGPDGATDQEHQSPDLLSKFLSAKEKHPDFMTDKLVQTMAVSMAFAGSETTAISLSAVFYYLLRNPSTLARLRKEIDSAARSGLFHDHEDGIVTFQEAQQLPYLDACIKEAFRMHPAAGLPLERIVPEPGVEIAGHYVKGGTIVGCSAWIIHRRKELWGDDVDSYRPERWIVDKTLRDGPEKTAQEAAVRRMTGHMFQFGMGSRTCIGRNISLLEIYKLVPSMLRRFEVSHPTYL
jgi:cytochrome P450